LDRYKIDNFIKDNPSSEFPWFETIDGDALNNIKAKAFDAIERELGLEECDFTSKFEAIKKGELSKNAGEDNFNLEEIISAFDLKVQEFVYVNWHRFDRVDKIMFLDLCKYFDYVWYPESDDIEIFDEDLSWMVSISHGGQVSLKYK